MDCGKTTVSFQRQDRQARRDLHVALVRLGALHREFAHAVVQDGDRDPSVGLRRRHDGQRDREQAAVVRRPGPLGIHVHGRADAALERAVLDLEQVIRGASLGLRPLALARDHERPLVDDDVDVAGLDPREVDDHAELVGLRRMRMTSMRGRKPPRSWTPNRGPCRRAR